MTTDKSAHLIQRVAKALQAEADKWPVASQDRAFVFTFSHRKALAIAAIEALADSAPPEPEDAT